MHKIPLFPLNTVLFPKGSIPLHVFEDRYKCMIKYCIDSKSPFGVILIRMGSEVGDSATPYDVGTTANIVDVNKIENGRLFITAIGDKVFRIKNLIEKKAFLEANVEFLVDYENTEKDISETMISKLTELITRNHRLLLGLKGEFFQDSKIPTDLFELSYFAPSCLLSIENIELQSLLEESSTKKRLVKSIELLKKNESFLDELLLKRFNLGDSNMN
ncbi:MAG: hypothetical protein FI718_05105 [SAR202 cluster bacterium]|nr:hypothetical protein [SAR202 cluster bacterium]|tara:strand:+ start:3208 stop:3858 length:651 start_codon:yes stop_codon:yes gene_type:complete